MNKKKLDVIAPGKLPSLKKSLLSSILEICDEEFIPPLSVRSGTTQKNLTDIKSNSDILDYLNQVVKQQYNIVKMKDSSMLGFMSFTINPKIYVFNPYKGNCYVSTVCVVPFWRGKGLCQDFYSCLISWAKDNKYKFISTRTWSSNNDHIHILEKVKFNKIKEIVDGRGTGINTCYFLLPL